MTPSKVIAVRDGERKEIIHRLFCFRKIQNLESRSSIAFPAFPADTVRWAKGQDRQK